MTTLVVYPAQPIAKLITELGYDAHYVWAKYPEIRDDFRALVREHCRLRWTYDYVRWQRTIGELSGPTQDRAAEVAHHLLAAGFPVQFPDERTREMTLTVSYAQECRRWILAGVGRYQGWFRIWWGREADYYAAARAITASQYDGDTSSVVVPSEVFDEVADFAQRYDFQVHAEAEVILRQARATRAQAYTVSLAAPQQPTTPYVGRANLQPEFGSVAPQFVDYQSHDFQTTTTLLPHQVPALEKVRDLTICGLFMDMGTGKTRCAIELAHLHRQRIRRVVWFCPVSLKETARYEFLKHTTLAESAVYIFDDKSTEATIPTDAFVYIVGIESMSSSDRTVLTVAGLLDEFTMAIVDESSYIKGHSATRTRRITALAEKARYRLILTGTPLSQGVEDLFAQMRFLSSQILGYESFYSFAANHLEYSDKYPGMVVRAHNVPWLTAKIAPYVYQVSKEDAGLNLPEKLYERRYYSLSDAQLMWYAVAKEEILLDVEPEAIESYTIFKLFNALQQIVSGFWRRNGELIEIDHQRISMLSGIIEALPDEKVIIWCKFVRSVRAIAKALGEQYGNENVALYYGGLTDSERHAELERFHNDSRFLVATMATGGHGLTLVESACAIFYENEFKYSHRIQAEDRIHRIGQTRRPTYVDIFANCGIERKIAGAMDKKENLVQAFKREIDRAKDKNELIGAL